MTPHACELRRTTEALQPEPGAPCNLETYRPGHWNGDNCPKPTKKKKQKQTKTKIKNFIKKNSRVVKLGSMYSG
jgi:hypothetical protein